MKWIGAMVAAMGGVALGAAQPAAPASNETKPMAAPLPTERLTVGEMMQRSGGSLLRASLNAPPDPTRARLNAVSFISVPEPEPKTVKKHDLVTIVIREQSEFSSDGQTDLKKEADFDAKLESLPKMDSVNGQINSGNLIAVPPQVKMSGSRNLKGEATVDRTDSFTTRISAEVVDVKPNGTFVIQARKLLKHDEEVQEYVLTGVCRAADLTPDNTLLSTQIHNLEIITTHKGAVRDTTKRGLVPKIMDFLNPF